MKRSIKINFNDGTSKELILSKATAIRADVGLLHIDKLNEGYRLTVSNDICEDFSKVLNLEIVRED